jgi:hypothetical protein
MPRIDIELTSSRPDGSWTWRAAGARQPKGTLDGSLLHAGAKPGEVVRADVEVDVDGMTVTAVLPPKTKRPEGERLEVVGPPARERPDVSVERAPRRPGDRGDRDLLGEGRGPGPGPRRERERERDRSAGGPARPASGAPRREGGGPTRPGGPGAGRRGGPAGERGDRDRGERGDRDRGRPPRERPSRPAAAAAAGPPAPPPRPRPKRLHAGRVHRDAVLASLPPEERPIAEQVLRAGIPGVRQALEEQNAAARAAGAPEVKTDALVALAESLLPRLRAAEWRDRAEAAVGQVDELALRDLRALVVGSEAAGRDESSRDLAGRLRQALEDRSARERDAWLDEITGALDAGRVVRALRSSARPPEPGVRFPAELAERLGTAASEAMAPDAAPDRWAAVLDAVTTSPVRRVVRPRGLPQSAPPELLQAARQVADRVPGLVALVGPAAQPASAAAGGVGRPRRPGGAPPGAGPVGRSRPGPGARRTSRPPGGPAPRIGPPPEADAAGGSAARPSVPSAEPRAVPEPAGQPAENSTADDEPAGPADAHPAAPDGADGAGERAENPPAPVEPAAAAAGEPAAPGSTVESVGPAPGSTVESAGPAGGGRSGDDGDDAVLVEELG